MPPEPLPDTMQAVAICGPGPPNVLQATLRPVPEPAADEVLIKVAAAGINRPDCLQRRGLYPPPDGVSDLPGLEVAGEVVNAGGDLSATLVGESVCALLSGGGYAEYCVAPAVQCLPIPMGLTPVQAAALPETFFTVWSNVFDRGQLQPGETLLVHGGASGIGTTAIQIAVTMGAHVIATAGSDEKLRTLQETGRTSSH